MKKIFFLFLTIICLAANIAADSGSCGDNLRWTRNGDDLRISGTGDMTNYGSDGGPWHQRSGASGPGAGVSYYTDVLTIAEGCTSIGRYAFCGRKIRTNNLPKSLITISDYAFKKGNYYTTFYSLLSLDNVKTIGEMAFFGSYFKWPVRIGSSCTSIGAQAFAEASLEAVYMFSVNPPTSGSNVFPNGTSIHIACGCDINKYKAAYPNVKEVVYDSYLPFVLALGKCENGKIENTAPLDCNNKVATLVPVPDEGYYFEKWSDGGTEETRTFTITKDTCLSATFEKYRIVTVTAGEGGIATGGGNQFKKNQTITITATPDDGYYFEKWSGNTSSSDNPYSVTVDNNRTYHANFAKYLKVVTTAGEHGSVTGGGDKFKKNDKATVSATPDDGYYFEKWSDGNSSASRSITVTKDSTLQATFAKYLKVTTTAGEHGSVTGGGDKYKKNQTTTIRATPDEGYYFEKWSDGSTSASRTITITQDSTLTATFAKYLHVTTTAGEHGSVTGGGDKFKKNDQTTITATADDGYYFEAWSDGNTEETRTLTVTKDENLTATFAKYLKVTTTAGEHGTATGGGEKFKKNDQTTLVATPDDGYYLEEWSDGNTEETRTLTVTKDENLTATFAKYLKVGASGEHGTFTGTGDRFKKNEQTTLVAIPEDGYYFEAWSDGNTNETRTITVTQDENLTATFAKYLKVEANGEHGTFTGTGDRFKKNDKTTLVAIPDDGYYFETWSDDIKDSSRIITVTQDENLIATFAKYLKVEASGENGTFTGTGDRFKKNDQATITAIPNRGYTFEMWSDGSTENPRPLTVTQDITLIATFIGNLDPTLNPEDLEGLEVKIYNLSGRLMSTENLNDLPKGFYIVEYGKRIKKIVISK